MIFFRFLREDLNRSAKEGAAVEISEEGIELGSREADVEATAAEETAAEREIRVDGGLGPGGT